MTITYKLQISIVTFIHYCVIQIILEKITPYHSINDCFSQSRMGWWGNHCENGVTCSTCASVFTVTYTVTKDIPYPSTLEIRKI